uniref:G_PROTEIN_RECEP_F1_2 domain-containing protein n=1 Tax=Syphacia muris TaxID=451379 RepID=A0A0N5ANA0_9BILA
MDYAALPAVIIYCILIIVGTAGNASLIYATVVNKKLHHATNLIIASQAVADIAYLVSHLVVIIEIIENRTSIPFIQCFKHTFVSNVAINFSVMISLFVALDRLLCVAFPFWYMRVKKCAYLIIAYTVTLIWSIPITWLTEVFTDAYTIVNCSLVGIYQGSLKFIWRGTIFVTNCLTLAIYVFIYRYVKLQQGEVQKKKLLKSLLIMASMTTPSRFFLTVVVMIPEFIPMSDRETFLLMIYVRAFVSFSISTNYFVLYSCSADYRSALRQQLGLKPRQVVPAKTRKVSTRDRLNDATNFSPPKTNLTP